MEHALVEVKAAVKQLLAKLRPGDAATLVGFNDTMFVAAEREKDPRTREDAVDLLTSWGGTALYDATVRVAGPGEPRVGPQRRRHLLRRRRPQQPDTARDRDGARAGERRDAVHRRLRRRRDGAQLAKPGWRATRKLDRRPRVLPAAHAGARRACSTRSSRSWRISTCSRIRRRTLKQDNGWRNIKVRGAQGQVRHQGPARDIGQPDRSGRGGNHATQAAAASSAMAATAALSIRRRRAVAVGATGRPRSDARVPQRHRGRHRRRRRRRQARAASARSRARRLRRDRRRAAAARRHRRVRRSVGRSAAEHASRPDVVAGQHERRRRHRPPVRVHRRSEHARAGQRAPWLPRPPAASSRGSRSPIVRR